MRISKRRSIPKIQREIEFSGMELSEEQVHLLIQKNLIRASDVPDRKIHTRASVLIPMFRMNGNWHLLFIRRTDLVKDHKGQVAFPGGAAEPGDSSPEITALRETEEEIGLKPSEVNLLGRLNDLFTPTGYLIAPIIGQIKWPFEIKLSPQEVSRVFTIPIGWLADPANRAERYYQPQNGQRHKVIYFKDYDGELLWGITARLTLDFLRVLGLAKR